MTEMSRTKKLLSSLFSDIFFVLKLLSFIIAINDYKNLCTVSDKLDCIKDLSHLLLVVNNSCYNMSLEHF